jgi:hypothetical protein
MLRSFLSLSCKWVRLCPVISLWYYSGQRRWAWRWYTARQLDKWLGERYRCTRKKLWIKIRNVGIVRKTQWQALRSVHVLVRDSQKPQCAPNMQQVDLSISPNSALSYLMCRQGFLLSCLVGDNIGLCWWFYNITRQWAYLYYMMLPMPCFMFLRHQVLPPVPSHYNKFLTGFSTTRLSYYNSAIMYV